MSSIPCIDCITLPICSSKDEERSSTGRIVELTRKCCLIYNYLQLDDNSPVVEKEFAELQGNRIIGLIDFFGWRNHNKNKGDQVSWIICNKPLPKESSTLKNDPILLKNRERLITYSINAQMKIGMK